MNRKNITTRLREIRREVQRATRHLDADNFAKVDVCMSMLELHVQAIRAELEEDEGDCDDGQGPREDYSTGGAECENGID
jgi:hypothetical protein